MHENDIGRFFSAKRPILFKEIIKLNKKDLYQNTSFKRPILFFIYFLIKILRLIVELVLFRYINE